MKVSNKLKTQLQKRLTSAIAVLAVLVLVFACSNINTIKRDAETSVATVENTDSAAKNEINVIKDSTGINIHIIANNEDGINVVEVYQGTTIIQSFSYTGSEETIDEQFKINIPFGENHQITMMVNGETVAQKNVENMRYIYNVNDLVKLRDKVNDGENFDGKYIELMDNIDMKDICSASIGSWTPIGGDTFPFKGNFNGNYHTIDNLYINRSDYQYLGLFSRTNGNTMNLLMKNVSVTNNFSVYTVDSYTGAIAGESNGNFFNCGVYSGRVAAKSSVGSGNDGIWKFLEVGGLVGIAKNNLCNCFNRANVVAENMVTYQTYQGGANAGGISGCTGGTAAMWNCYNTGTIYAWGRYAYRGGISGTASTTNSAYPISIKNCYSTGVLQGSGNVENYPAAISPRIGDWNGVTYTSITNCYFGSSSASYSYYRGRTGYSTGRVAESTIKEYANTLEAASWVSDTYGLNNGYPILRWQVPQLELDKKQEYVKVGEQIHLTINDSKMGGMTPGTITWASDNSNIATVDSNGIVTAIKEGITTIYATESTYGICAMMIVNVSKADAVAYSQIASGGYDTTTHFSIILKEDGTVWRSW